VLYADQPKYQRLQINFEKGEDPDDAYSNVPYEKGANFLLHLGESFARPFRISLEQRRDREDVGRAGRFLPYVKHYVQTFMGQSITTQQWKDDLLEYFAEDEEASKALRGVLWDVRCFVGVNKYHHLNLWNHRNGCLERE
jgi:leukotriene-A4 hydrolase